MSREQEPLEFTKVGEAVYVSKVWPGVVLIADELLAAADGKLMLVDGDTITFKCLNGVAQYQRSLGDGVLGAKRYELRAYTYAPMEGINAA